MPLEEPVLVYDSSKTAQIVEAAIQKSRQIATLPNVVVRIIQHCEDPRATMEELNTIILMDPVLVARVLKLVNSAYYGMSGQVKSIKQATMMLGVNAVKNIAIAASLVKLVRRGLVSDDFDAGELWTHSIAVAAGSRLLSRRCKLVTADEAFLGGLIHDMGIIVEMQACGSQFAQLIRKVSKDREVSFRRVEEEIVGASHEAFGTGLCQAWNFPLSLQYATSHHHRPWDLEPEHRLLPALVHVADILAARTGLGYTRTIETEAIDPQVALWLNLTEQDFEEIVAELPDAMRESRQLLSES